MGEMRIKEVRELTEEQERYNETKESEIQYLLTEKDAFNKAIKVKKVNMAKHIDEVNARIKMLAETVATMDQGADIESRFSPSEGRFQHERRTQGLKTVV